MLKNSKRYFVPVAVGIGLTLGLAQSALAVTFRTDWTGQILGYRAEGAFSYDQTQSYTDSIVRRDDLTDFDISFFDPDNNLIKTFEDNHLNYSGFNFNFDTRTQEILQEGFSDESNGIDIGEFTSPLDEAGQPLLGRRQPDATGLNFWSAAPTPNGEPIPHVHLTDLGDEFPDLPVGFVDTHLDVAFFTRTRSQLLDDPSAGEQLGQRMTATKVPEPGLLGGIGVIALLLNRRRQRLLS